MTHSSETGRTFISPVGLSITESRAAPVIESPVANKVTSIPSFTSASASTEATCSHGPEPRYNGDYNYQFLKKYGVYKHMDK